MARSIFVCFRPDWFAALINNGVIRPVLLALLLLLSPRVVAAGPLTLSWSLSPEPDVVGYLVSVSASSGLKNTIDVGKQTSFQFTEPDPTIPYSFTVRAYASTGLISEHSELVQSTPMVSPTATTSGATAITATGALVNGSANPNGTSTIGSFEFGLTTSYGWGTTPIALGGGIQTVAIGNNVLSGLTCGTLYHFRAVAKSEGGVARGADATFTTLPCDTSLPPGFSKSVMVSGLNNPTAMAFLPDGRLLVGERGGSLRVIKSGALLATPFVSLTVDQSGERGLLGVAIDPAFAQNGYVYVYYTATSPGIHNRVSRLIANGDVAIAGSETTVVDLDPLGSATINNGGAIDFGPDGMLYVGVGDNGQGADSQSLSNRFGKMLRVRPDGTIPSDNPLYGVAVGANRAIWALGLREPSSMAFQPLIGQMFINDVGNAWEEVNVGTRGANYGWALVEGATSNPGFVSPSYAYDQTAGCAIAGGAYHNLMKAQFPMQYWGGYFFADRCEGWIRFRSSDGNVSDFASGIASPVDLKMSADGTLYVLAQRSGGTTGAVERIEYEPSGPSVDLTVDSSDDPAFVDPSRPFKILLSFNPGSLPVLQNAELTVGVSTPLGDVFFLDASGKFVSNGARVFSGPLGAFGPSVVFQNQASLPRGAYLWFVLVNGTSSEVLEGQLSDTVVTVIQ